MNPLEPPFSERLPRSIVNMPVVNVVSSAVNPLLGLLTVSEIGSARAAGTINAIAHPNASVTPSALIAPPIQCPAAVCAGCLLPSIPTSAADRSASTDKLGHVPTDGARHAEQRRPGYQHPDELVRSRCMAAGHRGGRRQRDRSGRERDQ